MNEETTMRAGYDRITTTIERPAVSGDHRWHEEDRIPPDQAVLDEALREGLGAI